MNRAASFLRAIGKTMLWLGAILWVAVLASWIISLYHPHGTMIERFRRYGIWCDRGVIQLRYGIKTEIVDGKGGWQVVEVGVNAKRTGNPLSDNMPTVNWSRGGPQITLSRSKPFQTAEFLAGGEIPLPDGTFQSFGDHTTIWGVPHLVPASALAVPSAILALMLWRRVIARGRAKGFCGKCGYDLRATPDRCPECGELQNLTRRDAASARTSSASSSPM